jgi:hypothetical protein
MNEDTQRHIDQQEWGHLLAVEEAAYRAYAALVRLSETLDAAPETRQQIDEILLNWRPVPEPDWRVPPH